MATIRVEAFETKTGTIQQMQKTITLLNNRLHAHNEIVSIDEFNQIQQVIESSDEGVDKAAHDEENVMENDFNLTSITNLTDKKFSLQYGYCVNVIKTISLIINKKKIVLIMFVYFRHVVTDFILKWIVSSEI